MSDERIEARALNTLKRAILGQRDATWRGLRSVSDNDALAWSATRSDEELRLLGNFGSASLAWVRSQRPAIPWAAGELEHAIADFLALLPAQWSWSLSSPWHDVGWALRILDEEGMAFSGSEMRGPSVGSVFRSAAQALPGRRRLPSGAWEM